MPEIKPVIEKTRTAVHREDTADFNELKLTIKEHCDMQIIREQLVDERDAKTEKKLDKLMPLVELAPLLRDMIEERKAYTIVAAKIIKWIAVIASIIGLIGGALAIIKYWRE